MSGYHRGVALNAITRREMDVLRLVAIGLSNRLIAEQLNIGFCTVKNHVSRILEKTHTSNRRAAASHVLGNQTLGACILEKSF